MAEISKGAAAWTAMEDIGKADASKANSDLLVTLRDKLADALFRQQPGGYGSTDKMTMAKGQAGKCLDSWAKDLVWQVSWSNPAIAREENKVLSAQATNNIIEDIIYDFLPDGEYNLEGVVESLVKRNRDYKPEGYGGILGYGLPRKESNKIAQDFIRWCEEKVIRDMSNAIVLNKAIGTDGKNYGVRISPDRYKKDSITQDLYKISTRSLLASSRGGLGRLIGGTSDRRWWL
jgi:hypothetical protein